jgi:transposase InsO family protein
MDTKRYARFLRPGHAKTGIRDKTAAEKRARWGYEYAHSIIDDHSRVAYTELHPDQRAATVTGFVTRALAWYASIGVAPRRIMTDNAWTYTRNRSLQRLLRDHRIRHLLIRPRTPRTNGKVERFHQTMSREWAYGVTYHDHHARDQALPYWLDHYNRQRPHSSLGGHPPISRVHNLCGQDT